MLVRVACAAKAARVLAGLAAASSILTVAGAIAAPLGPQEAVAGSMTSTAVALAVLPPVAGVADMEAHDAARKRPLWPTHAWATSTPEEQGIDSAVLANAMETIRARHLPVHSLLIERHGKIVLDAYFHPFADNELHDVASVTKSVMSTLVGIAIGERRMADVDTPVLAMLPDSTAAVDPLKRRMMLADVLSMTSGLDCSNENGRNFLQQMEGTQHWVSYAIERPEVAEPGTKFTYCAGNMHIVSAVLTRSTGVSAAAFAQSELFAPLGIQNVAWPTDGDGVSHGFADLKLQPRDMAKLGYLWLHNGEWEGRQIVSPWYLDAALTAHATVKPNVEYGFGLWLYPRTGHAGGPADFEANGSGGQRIAVIPSQDMVEVITGSGLNANAVASLLVGAVKSDSALAPNSVWDERLKTRVVGAGAMMSVRYAELPKHLPPHRVPRISISVAALEMP
jgi:CubicO group peptidase (beta-lactamase class C family)